LVYHADLAAQTGASALIIGDEFITPALPGGKLPDGSPSLVPDYAAERWAAMIQTVRSRYTGKLGWMVAINSVEAGPTAPEFLNKFDLVYARIAAPLAGQNASKPQIEAAFHALLEGPVKSLHLQSDRPVVISLAYSSAAGTETACVKVNDKCAPFADINQPGRLFDGTPMALDRQAAVYDAALEAVNQLDWITGFTAYGYNPSAALRDYSTSVRSKPAGDVLWYWYPKLLGVGP
jgi:hypothetical protein